MLKRPTRIDALTRSQHHHLKATDEAYYFLEYGGRSKVGPAPANKLIANFKCSLEYRETSRWAAKIEAIEQVAAGIASCMHPDALKNTTFVPVPPSKTRDDPSYDDRCVEALRTVCRFASQPIDVRELVVQMESTTASHESEVRLQTKDLIAIYRIDEALVTPTPSDIVVFDDMLTTGSHFKAMQHVLKARFPSVTVRGLFIARRRI